MILKILEAISGLGLIFSALRSFLMKTQGRKKREVSEEIESERERIKREGRP